MQTGQLLNRQGKFIGSATVPDEAPDLIQVGAWYYVRAIEVRELEPRYLECVPYVVEPRIAPGPVVAESCILD
jgi:hypothetical protein